MPRILVVDNHDSYTFNLVQALDALTGERCDVVPVDRFRPDDPDAYDAVVISPGPGHPAHLPEFAACLDLLRRRTRPTLGVCLGHQGMIVAHGGAVDRVAPAHGVVDRLRHDGTGLFAGLPQDTPVVRYHSLAGIRIPDVLRVTATGRDGTVMALAHASLPQWGVQFHPESILTTDGTRMLASFLALARAPIAAAAAPAPAPAEPEVSFDGLAELPAWIEPDAAAPAILGGRDRAFWLDSADARPWTGRFSIMGYLDAQGRSIAAGPRGDRGGCRETVPRGELLARLRELHADLGAPAAVAPPAIGGWVGVAGYETQELLPDDTAGTVADGFFLRVDRAVVWDHAARRMFVWAEAPAAEAELRGMVEAAASDPAPAPPALAAEVAASAVHPSFETYAARFDLLQEALRAGDTYEGVLTFPVEVRAAADPLEIYRALRRRNPAPYAAYLRHDDRVVLSTSPERMLRVTADGTAQVRPIKGTLPRSPDPQVDALNRWRLASADAYLRENLMIADLVRNDLGRVSLPGSVRVTQFLGVEEYATVFQLVTAVEGRLEPGVTPIDALRAVFPAGSMTGAPKRRTMELIREAEPAERGIYSGALGWFGPQGADFAVVIRTWTGSVATGAYRIGAGGAILIDSSPEAEYAEALTKAASVLP